MNSQRTETRDQDNSARARPTRVFVSYSRKDAAFAEELLKILRLAGYDPLFDREDILGGEAWKARLMSMLNECDIFCPILSPNWTASETCEWEAREARSRAKRVLPILLEAPGDALPDWITALNYVRFDEPGDMTDKYLALADALKSDVGWYRASSALLLRAQSWQGGAEGIVLRGEEITDAQALLDNRPPGAPEPTKLQLDFLAASEAAEHERNNAERRKLEREKRLLSRVRLGMGIFALALVAGGALLYWLRQDLRAAELRLEEGLTLTIAETDRTVMADPRWIRLATQHKLALAVLQDARGRIRSTAFLVPGAAFSPDWTDKTVLMTAGHVFSTDRGPGNAEFDAAKEELQASFPAHQTGTRYPLGDVLFWSPFAELDVALIELDAPLPRFATTIWPETETAFSRAIPENRGGIAVLQWNHQTSHTLGIGHRIESPVRNAWAARAIFYNDIASGGSSGSPVFDMDSANLICLHQRGGGRGGAARFGACTPILDIQRAVQASLR